MHGDAQPRRLPSTRALILTVMTAGALLAASVTPADACSCLSSGPACQSFWKADAVFDGTVTAIHPITRDVTLPPQRTVQITDSQVTMSVRQAWKGLDAGGIDVITSSSGASCGFDFKVGRRYLVFAHHNASDGRLHVSLCSFTREFDGTGESAEFLASLAAPEPGGRVFGTIELNQRSFRSAGTSGSRTPIDLDVRLTGSGRTFSTKASRGRFEFSGLTPGNYEVEIALPAGYSTWRTGQSAEIPSTRACAQVDFHIAPAGRISGWLVSRTGASVANVEVQVTGADTPLDQSYVPVVSDRSRTDGHFEIRDLPPGRYLVGISLRDLPNQWNPYARTIYPAGNEPPFIVDLSLGQAVELGRWQLEPPLAVVRIAGLITWKDGTPATAVYVFLLDVSRGDDRMRGAGGALSGPDGQFVIDGREGRVYRLRARRGGTGPGLIVSAPEVEARPGMDPLRLVIQSDPPR
jgi:Tissue inhibitor of metalloproteinase